jgi:hypothetical protein
MTAVNLHNFLMTENNSTLDENIYCPLNYIDNENYTEHVTQGAWRSSFNQNNINNLRPTTNVLYIEQ